MGRRAGRGMAVIGDGVFILALGGHQCFVRCWGRGFFFALGGGVGLWGGGGGGGELGGGGGGGGLILFGGWIMSGNKMNFLGLHVLSLRGELGGTVLDHRQG